MTTATHCIPWDEACALCNPVGVSEKARLLNWLDHHGSWDFDEDGNIRVEYVFPNKQQLTVEDERDVRISELVMDVFDDPEDPDLIDPPFAKELE